MRRAVLMVVGLAVVGCKSNPEADASAFPNMVGSLASVVIEPAPASLQGRVALPAGARLYSAPSFTSPSWELTLPDPPAIASDAPARTRAFRVVGIVRSDAAAYGSEFLAITNDLDGEDESAPRGCGSRFRDLDHLRALLYVPIVYLAEVTTRTLELEPWSWAGDQEQLIAGAGTRVGSKSPTGGLPPPPTGSSWRWIDADGIRMLAAIPDDAVGKAWDPHDTPKRSKTGEELMQDPEGSILWLGDDGGATVVLGVRNDCAEHQRVVTDPSEVESLRALAMDVFYDQSPPLDPEPAREDDADYLIAAGTPLRRPDGELAGEVLSDWGVSVGVGQTWGDRRCFPLELGGELRTFDQQPLACVSPSALTPLADAAGFSASDDVERGGNIEIGPAEILVQIGGWTAQQLRPVFNEHHDSVAECLLPLLESDTPPLASRWVLELQVEPEGRVQDAQVTALGETHTAVEDCLRVEAYTWLMPRGGGQVLVPITLGDWDNLAPASPPAKPKPKPKPESKPKPTTPDSERGKVIIIRDEDDTESLDD